MFPPLADVVHASHAAAPVAAGFVTGFVPVLLVLLPCCTGATGGSPPADAGAAGVEAVGVEVGTSTVGLIAVSGGAVGIGGAAIGVIGASPCPPPRERAASTAIEISKMPPTAARPMMRPWPPPLLLARPLVTGGGGNPAATG